MSDDNFYSIIDFGSSKIRLGIFSDYLPDSKYIKEYNINDRVNKDKIQFEKIIENIIFETEKEIDRHLTNMNIMIDTPDTLFIDLSVKKKIENIKIDKSIIKNYVNEARILIEKNYEKFNILHLIISKYLLDDIEFIEIPIDHTSNNLIIEFKFILFPKYKIEFLRNLFKDRHISIDRFFNSSYIKSSNYIKYFEKFEIKFFLDIGFKKSSLSIYNGNRLSSINYLSLGGEHITQDILKILNIDHAKAEKFKQNINQSNTSIKTEDTKDTLIKVIHARIEEIIDLSFKAINFDLFKNKKSILVFMGEGSKILSKNSIYLKDDYNFFDDMNFFEDSTETICKAAYLHNEISSLQEVNILNKVKKKRGFFEKLFHLLGK